MSIENVPNKPLPHVLHIQVDNYWKDNKSRYAMLVARRIVNEIIVSLMLVGHKHDGIDASFGCWSMKLFENDYLIVPNLMKLYMEFNNVISHLIEEVIDSKAFIANYINDDNDELMGH